MNVSSSARTRPIAPSSIRMRVGCARGGMKWWSAAEGSGATGNMCARALFTSFHSISRETRTGVQCQHSRACPRALRSRWCARAVACKARVPRPRWSRKSATSAWRCATPRAHHTPATWDAMLLPLWSNSPASGCDHCRPCRLRLQGTRIVAEYDRAGRASCKEMVSCRGAGTGWLTRHSLRFIRATHRARNRLIEPLPADVPAAPGAGHAPHRKDDGNAGVRAVGAHARGSLPRRGRSPGAPACVSAQRGCPACAATLTPFVLVLATCVMIAGVCSCRSFTTLRCVCTRHPTGCGWYN